MRFTRAVVGLLLAAATSPCVVVVEASFEKDVLRSNIRKNNQFADVNEDKQLRNEILTKAMPLAEYEAQLNQKGLTSGMKIDSSSSSTTLQRQLQNDDDFSVDDTYMYSFSGYSMKYAKCQPVQYFSENAVLAGEHSPMVTQDIVILRLCPYKSCSESSTYGCYYNFAEYAISLSDYVAIMLKYATKKREYTCDWCDQCINAGNGRRHSRRRKLEDAAGDDAAGDDAGDVDAGDDAAEADEEDDAAEADEEDDAAGDDAGDDAAGDDAAAGDDSTDDRAAYACDGYSSYCSDYDTLCGDNDDTYLDYEGYEDYLDCAEVKYNDYAYFVRPRCDGYAGSIKMAVYYDNYCIQYAGNDISIKDLGLGFKEGVFKDFYSSTCIDCSESENPPNFDTSSILCNYLHMKSATCTTELMYDLFENDEDESTECSYIEALRFGAYDELGQFASNSQTNSWSAEVTVGQKIWMGAALGTCVFFVIYACYLHHSMTNLLIKSLSHRELLPPRNSRRSPGRGRSVGSKQRLRDEPDWDDAPNPDKILT